MLGAVAEMGKGGERGLDLPREYGHTLRMARTTVKATYSLDPETVRKLEQMARRWGVSKSEALARAIRRLAAQPAPPPEAVAALDELQDALALTRGKAVAWARDVRRERRASPPAR